MEAAPPVLIWYVVERDAIQIEQGLTIKEYISQSARPKDQLSDENVRDRVAGACQARPRINDIERNKGKLAPSLFCLIGTFVMRVLQRFDI